MNDDELQQLLSAYRSECSALKFAASETERSLLAMRKRIQWLQEEMDRSRAKAVFVNEVAK